MKITKEKLKQIIKEELSEMERLPVPSNDPFGPDKTKEIKSHLRALKRIFDEVGLKSVPDEMKRGWSKMRGALEAIPGLNEEMSTSPLLGGFNFILLMKPGGERLSDLRYYRIQVEDYTSPSGLTGTVYYVMRDGQKIYLPERNGRLVAPSPTTGGQVIGHSEPMEQGEKIPLGQAAASVGKMIKKTPPPEQMGQP